MATTPYSTTTAPLVLPFLTQSPNHPEYWYGYLAPAPDAAPYARVSLRYDPAHSPYVFWSVELLYSARIDAVSEGRRYYGSDVALGLVTAQARAIAAVARMLVPHLTLLEGLPS